jgi:hypothetical protein
LQFLELVWAVEREHPSKAATICESNIARGLAASISGGHVNFAGGSWSSVNGGALNSALEANSTVSGGVSNTATVNGAHVP